MNEVLDQVQKAALRSEGVGYSPLCILCDWFETRMYMNVWNGVSDFALCFNCLVNE